MRQVIWFHDVHGPEESLRVAVTCPQITHVLLMGLGFDDVPAERPAQKLWRYLLPTVLAAGKTPILGRCLWPADTRFDPLDLIDHHWYGERLQRLQQWAESCGVTETALDVEPYAQNAAWTWRDKGFAVVDGKISPPMPSWEFDSIRWNAQIAADLAGPADYILPAPLPYPRSIPQREHLYRAVRPLGRAAIAEETYYDWEEPTWNVENSDWQIFGAYVLADPTAETTEEGRHCYTPAGILAESKRCRHRVMIYPGDAKQALTTAQAFQKLAEK